MDGNINKGEAQEILQTNIDKYRVATLKYYRLLFRNLGKIG